MHVTVDDIEITKSINEHIRDSKTAKIERNVVKRRAAESTESTSRVINECLAVLYQKQLQ